MYSILNENRRNPTWEAIGFPGADPVVFARLEGRGEYPKQYPYSFMEVQGTGNTMVLEYDALVVGSGAGGGIVAAELSKSGRKVLVLEKGIHLRPEEITTLEADSLPNLYEKGGVVSTAGNYYGALVMRRFLNTVIQFRVI